MNARRALVALLALVFAFALATGTAEAGKKLKPPKSFKVKQATSNSLKASWKDTSKGESYFEIKLKPGGKKIKARKNSSSVKLKKLAPLTTYKLSIRACPKKGKCSKYAKTNESTTAEVVNPGANAPQFGFNEPIVAGDSANKALTGSGAGFVRIPVNWAQIQAGLLTGYNFAALDKTANELASRGLKPLWVVSSAPCWAQPVLQQPTATRRSPARRPTRSSTTPTPNSSRRSASATRGPSASRSGTSRTSPSSGARCPDATAYRSLLKQTAAEASAAGVQVPIVFGAPSPTLAADAQRDPTKIQATDFIRKALQGGVPGLDAVALHPYSFNKPGDPVKTSIGLYDQFAAVAKQQAPNLPIWVTEVGFTTAGDYAVSPTEQAAALVETYKTLVARGVKLITVHRLFDDANPPFPFEAGMGVIAADRKTVKPAYCGLAGQRGKAPAGC